jgi:hypothetical protein
MDVMLSPAGTSLAGTIRTGRALADGLKDLLKFEIRGAKEAWMPVRSTISM